MNSIRFYGLLTAAGILASLILVVGPQPQSATAEPSPGTIAGVSVTIPDTTTTTRILADPNFAAGALPRMIKPELPTRKVVEKTGTKKAKAPAPSQPSAPSTPPTTTTTQPPATTSYEAQFAADINDYRASNGMGALARSGSLDAEAASWAKTMGQAGELYHSDLTRLIPPWGAVAENLGSGGSVSAIFSALVASSGHASNMLGDYTNMGIGVWVDSNGTIWTVHLFAA